MELLSKQRNWKIWQGFALQILCYILLLKVGSYMQFSWGMAGLAATEIMFLAVALLTVVLHRTPLKEVFPVKKISLREFIGLIFFFAGGFLLNFVSLGISFIVFPGQNAEVSSLATFMSGTNPFLMFLIVAVMPAICEEAIERGAVLSHLRSIKKDWVIVIIMGCFFGIFHMSPLRFLNTAMLGGILTYMVVKKNNILYSCLFHFMNNFMSFLALMMPGTQESAELAAGFDYSMFAPVLIMIGFVFPFFLVLGNYFMVPETFKRRHWVVAAVISSVVLLGGVILFAVKAMPMVNKMTNISCTYYLSEGETATIPITIEEDGVYTVSFAASTNGDHCEMSVTDADGDVLAYDEGSGMLTISGNLELGAGDYFIELKPDEGSDQTQVAFSGLFFPNKIY